MSSSGCLLLLLMLGLTQLESVVQPGNAMNATSKVARAGFSRTISSGSIIKAQRIDQVETGTLSPGGEYRFANGMAVGSTDFLYETVRISVEKIDPVALLLPQIHTPVSDFVRVKASGITEPGGQYMTVTFPYPADVNPRTLLIGSYLPEKIFKRNSQTPDKLILRLNVVLEIDETQKTVTFRTGLPEDQGYIFVLLKRMNIVTQVQNPIGLESQALAYKTHCGDGYPNSDSIFAPLETSAIGDFKGRCGYSSWNDFIFRLYNFRYYDKLIV
jgi:hypothetical protein